MPYKLEEARKIVLKCAKKYRDNLLNKRLLIIYRDREDNCIKSIEVTFYEKNYQHLTGLEMIDEEGNIIHHQSKNFFRKCIENKLRVDEIKFKKDGTTQLKLLALPILMDIHKVTKIAGVYNHSRPYLFMDKAIGNTNFCLGLTNERGIYVPSSALLEDIKNITTNPSQVLLIFIKEQTEQKYTNLKHKANGLDASTLKLPDEISQKIELLN